ncbi:hypothetical protein HHI36_018350, partial [Cryptolaemus montrouzieri]
HSRWAYELPQIEEFSNEIVHESTEYSPDELQFGNERLKLLPPELPAPLTGLLREQTHWKWTDDEENSLLCIKKEVEDATLLYHPDSTLPWHVKSDASYEGIAGVGFQIQGGERKLGTDLQPYLSTIVSSRDKVCTSPSKIFFDLKHSLGHENVQADALSRHACTRLPAPTSKCFRIEELLNKIIHETTGYSPNELLFGRERLKLIPPGINPKTVPGHCPEYSLQTEFKLAEACFAERAARRLFYYPGKNFPAFKEGDPVLLIANNTSSAIKSEIQRFLLLFRNHIESRRKFMIILTFIDFTVD